MGRKRRTNKHLPQRVYLKSGSYYFVDTNNAWHRLGDNLHDMYRELAQYVERDGPLHTMNAVFDRFIAEKLPLLAPRTQSDYTGYIENLRLYFGEGPPADVTSGDVFDYRNKRAKKSVVQANREKSCLSSVFTACNEWKLRNDNPCKLVPKLNEGERDRYVTDEEFLAVYRLATPVLQVAMDLATITGQREGDLLKMPCNDPRIYSKAGVVFKVGKSKRRHPRHGKVIETAKTLIVEWSDELHAVIDRARTLGPRLRPTLICNLSGLAYTESGFRSNWHKLLVKATKKGKDGTPAALADWFTFHDLRAKRASDAEDLEEANDALAHGDMKTTQKVYRRKPRRARAGAKILESSPDIRNDAT